MKKLNRGCNESEHCRVLAFFVGFEGSTGNGHWVFGSILEIDYYGTKNVVS